MSELKDLRSFFYGCAPILGLDMTPLIDFGISQVEDGARLFSICAPRRVGKSSFCALLAIYEMIKNPNAYICWVSPAERQSARIVRQTLEQFKKIVPDLVIKNQYARIENKKTGHISELEILSSSSGSAAGRKIDLLVCDETASPDFDQELFEILRPSTMHGGRTICISSPGTPESWFLKLLNDSSIPSKSFYDIAQFQHVDMDFVKEQKTMSEGSEWQTLSYERQYCGRWVSLSEANYLPLPDIRACSRVAVEKYDKRIDDVTIGVDIGVKRDLTSICVLGERWEEYDVSYRILQLESYDPKSFSSGRTDLDFIKGRIRSLAAAYSAPICIDSSQAEHLTQQLERENVFIKSFSVTGQLNDFGYTHLQKIVREKRITWKQNDRLENELANMAIEETRAGNIRFVDSSKKIHRDEASALMMALWYSLKFGMRGFKSEPAYDPKDNSEGLEDLDWHPHFMMKMRKQNEEHEMEKLMTLQQQHFFTNTDLMRL